MLFMDIVDRCRPASAGRISVISRIPKPDLGQLPRLDLGQLPRFGLDRWAWPAAQLPVHDWPLIGAWSGWHVPHPDMHVPHVQLPRPSGHGRFELPLRMGRRRSADPLTGGEVIRMLACVAGGAALMYLLDPNMGRRRRKMTADRSAATLRRMLRDAGHTRRRMGASIGGRMQALIHIRAAEQLLDDTTLARKVESILYRDPTIHKGNLNINCEHGTVMVRGVVETTDQIRDIEARVRMIDGVQDVHSLLHLVNTPAS